MKHSYRSYPKVNIFLKITGKRGSYHTICSRFVKIKSFYDEIEFESSSKGFDIAGNFSCPLEQNSIYKAYISLLEHLGERGEVLRKFFADKKVVVEKRIREGSGLGGGSSNAATFLLMCNDLLELGLSLKELASIGSKVGSDVPFFVYGFDSANVSGVGEIVEEFDEVVPSFEVVTPDIFCSTPAVYRCFSEEFYKTSGSAYWEGLKSSEALKTHTSYELNDLLGPALKLYPKLKEYAEAGMFFSGSGSSFFGVKNAVCSQ